MKIGIIIVFHNNENDIEPKCFVRHVNEAKDLALCLVNNASKDGTYELLKEIKASCLGSVSLVDVKRFKSDVSAVRSGARVMFNQSDLKHIGYFNVNLFHTETCNISELIQIISKNQDTILKYNLKVMASKEMKQTLFQSVFSIADYLDKLKFKTRHFILEES